MVKILCCKQPLSQSIRLGSVLHRRVYIAYTRVWALTVHVWVPLYHHWGDQAALLKPVYCCVCVPAKPWTASSGSNRSLQLLSPRRDCRAPRLSLGVGLRSVSALTGRVLRRTSPACSLRLPGSLPCSCVDFLKSSARTKPAAASRPAHPVPSAWNGLWAHPLRPSSPGLGRTFLNHPTAAPYSPTTLNRLRVFLLKLGLQSTYHFLTFYNIFVSVFSSIFFPH